MAERTGPVRALRWVFGAALLAGVATLILVMIVRLAESSSTDITDLAVGDCFQLDPEDDGSVGLVDVIDCDEPHDAEVLAVADLNPDGDLPYPDDDALFSAAESRCAVSVGADDPRFGVVAIAPTEAAWNSRQGRAVCVAVPYGGEQVTGRFGVDTSTARTTVDA